MMTKSKIVLLTLISCLTLSACSDSGNTGSDSGPMSDNKAQECLKSKTRTIKIPGEPDLTINSGLENICIFTVNVEDVDGNSRNLTPNESTTQWIFNLNLATCKSPTKPINIKKKPIIGVDYECV